MRMNSMFSGLGVIVLVILALPFLAWLTEYSSNSADQSRYPWGYARPGKATLTGTWVGPLVTHSNQRLGMLVEIRLAPLGDQKKWRREWLEGRVLVCARPGRVQSYQAWGAPEDTRTASRFFLAIGPAGNVALGTLSPSRLSGQWGGKDAIDLLVSLYMENGKPAVTSLSHPDTRGETRATLARGTEADFDTLCKRLPPQGKPRAAIGLYQGPPFEAAAADLVQRSLT